MGAALNTAGAAEIAAELACCACSSVCGFLCKDHATRAKLRYCTILFFATIISFLMLVPGMRRNIDRIPNLCGKLVRNETCDKFFGFGAVYRIMLSMTTFYGMFAIFTIRITRINSFRAKFNNGFWIVKAAILLGITVGTFFIPKASEFFRIWMYVCLIGGFIFMLYLIIIVIDFGHSWSVSWAERLETSNSKLWYLAMVLATLLMLTITIAAIATFYVLFAGSHALSRCKANTFYITFIVIQCFLATVISVIPTVQQELAGAGLLQSSVVILYTTYLTFNTLSTEPDGTCNPLGKVILDYDKMSGINGEALFGCLLSFALVVFACTVRAHTSNLGKYGLAISESEEYALLTLIREEKQKSKDNDSEHKEISLDDFVGYNYSLFHTVMALTSLHLLMILTNWHSPDQKLNMKRLVKNWASVWVQMASSFICILLYIWFLVTPLVRKIWAPLFGIMPSETDVHRSYEQVKSQKSHPRQDKVQNMGDELKRQKSVGLEKINNDSVMTEGKVRSHIEVGNAKSENIMKTETKNEKIDMSKSSNNLKRYRSIESLKSAVLSITKRNSRNKIGSDENNSKNENSYDERSKGTIIAEECEQELEAIGQSQDHFHERLRDREENQKKKRGLTRFGSIESLRSGFSAISTATSRVKMKLRKNLGRREAVQTRDTAWKDRSLSKLEKSYDNKNVKKMEGILLNRTFDQSKSHDETRDSKNRHRNDKRLGNIKSDDEELKNSISPKRILKSQGRCTPVSEDEVKEQEKSHESGNHRDYVKENSAGATPEPRERPSSSNTSYGFKEKPQDPEVAREVLRLQWKILRMQAKVVKIQEKIIRIQAEDDVVKKNAQEAAEQMEPPIGQSSVVAGGIYLKRGEHLEGSRQKQNG